MKTYKKITALELKLKSHGININYFDIIKLRRAEMRLHRWYEYECGTDSGYIERDEETNIPYFISKHGHKYRVADREKGALKRIEEIIKSYEGQYHYYIQQDPRGCALFVSKEPLLDNNYSNGVAVCD